MKLPRNIYISRDGVEARRNRIMIQLRKLNLRVAAFRPPIPGDSYVPTDFMENVDGYPRVDTSRENFPPDQPRLIVTSN